MSAPLPCFTFEEIVAVTGGALLRPHPTQKHVDGIFTDSRMPQPGGLFIGIKGEQFDGSDYADKAVANGAVAVIVPFEKSAAIVAKVTPAAVIGVDSTTRAFGLLAGWHRKRVRARVVAVTGSNGKTTTKEMIASILSGVGATLSTQGNLNNEIGVPMTLMKLVPGHKFAVVELGMNHEGEIGRLTAMAAPHVGVVTLAAGVHVENFAAGVDGVSHAKAELYHGLRLDGVVVANSDDKLMTERARGAGRRTMWFGGSREADVRLSRLVSHDAQGIRCVLSFRGQDHVVQLPVVGIHNAMNACAATAACIALGASTEAIVAGLATARSPGRRLRLVPIPDKDATLLDDSYNANPASMMAALSTLISLAPPGHRIAVLGDMRELGADEVAGHRAVGAAAARAGLKLLIAFGSAASEIVNGARETGLAIGHVEIMSEPSDAAHTVWGSLEPGDMVLVKASRGTRLDRVADLLAPPPREEAH